MSVQNRTPFGNAAVTMLAFIVAACSARTHHASESPGAVANVAAEMRLVGSETTWVAQGNGYVLHARSTRDLAVLERQLDRQVAVFRRVFAVDPAPMQLTVAHDGSPNAPPNATPLIPEPGVPIVMIVLRGTGGDPVTRRDNDQPSRGERGPGRGDRNGSAWIAGRSELDSPLRPVVRAWLSARASARTGHPATFAQATGEVDDPRVAAWAEDALLGLGADSARVDRVAHELIASDGIFPLAEFFTMQRPPNVVRPPIDGQGRGEGGRPQGSGGGMGGRGGGGGGGGRGGIGGGMGGRGGMGGGMGRGGGARDGGSPRGGRTASVALSGGMLFSAEALVVSQCLAQREGAAFVGSLIEAQMAGKPVAESLVAAKAVPADLTRLDDYWRRWMAFRLQSANAH